MANGNEELPGSVQSLSNSPTSLPWTDLSLGKVNEDVGGLLTEQIEDRKQFRHFRKIAFYGVCLLVGLVFAALLAWIWCVGRRVADPFNSMTYQVALFVTPLIVLASMAALLVLALLRFAFRPMDGKDKDDAPDALSVVHGLGREALTVLKDYLGKKAG